VTRRSLAAAAAAAAGAYAARRHAGRLWQRHGAPARRAWHVFRGRPMAYRVGVNGGLVIGDSTRVEECDIRTGGRVHGLDVLGQDCWIIGNTLSGSSYAEFEADR
jgi:hypothetical protein